MGRSRLSFDDTLSSRTDSYLRAKLSAELAARNWRMTAFVNNPLDAEGDTFAYGNPFTFAREGVTPGHAAASADGRRATRRRILKKR